MTRGRLFDLILRKYQRDWFSGNLIINAVDNHCAAYP